MGQSCYRVSSENLCSGGLSYTTRAFEVTLPLYYDEPRYDRKRPGEREQWRRRHAVGFLVSGVAQRKSTRPKIGSRHAPRSSPGAWARRRRETLRASRCMSASRFSAVFRATRRRERRMRLSRVAIRRAHGPVPPYSVAYVRFETQVRANPRGQLSLCRTRRLHLGIHDRRRRSFRPDNTTTSAGASHLLFQLPGRAALG